MKMPHVTGINLLYENEKLKEQFKIFPKECCEIERTA